MYLTVIQKNNRKPIMKTSNQSASGILFTLTIIGVILVVFIVVIVADVEIGSLLEDQVNGAINSEINAKVAGAGVQAKSGHSLNEILSSNLDSKK